MDRVTKTSLLKVVNFNNRHQKNFQKRSTLNLVSDQDFDLIRTILVGLILS